MRLALISDIHGNKVALEAVLDAIATEKIEHIVCLGDVAASGSQPQQTVERLKELGCPIVMGNTDANLLHPLFAPKDDIFRQYAQDIDLWCSQQLSTAEKAFMNTFQATIEYPLDNGKILLGYHGSPRSYHERIQPMTPEEQLDEIFSGSHTAIMAGGHTHMQMLRRYKDSLIVNPGSVGLALDRVSPLNEARNPPWGEYAIIEIEGDKLIVELHRTPFDIQAFVQTIRTSGMPHADWLASEWGTDQASA
jgi:predicted phosphodiesterase